LKGKFGLEEILSGNHPNYNRTKLKERLINAGYFVEECQLCGFNKKRNFDNRCPLVLHCLDGNDKNLRLENLQMRCYNCSYLTTGHIAIKPEFNQGVYDMDILDQGITADDINELQNEMWENDE
jgi:hypothetical protein